MDLYLISRPDPGGYDEYQSAVVCARSVSDARGMHPGAGYWKNGRFNERDNKELWKEEASVCVWVSSSEVKVRLLGKAFQVKRGVVLVDFKGG